MLKRHAILLFIVSLIPVKSLYAQKESAAHISASASLVSQNVWRGCYLGGASIQPEAAVSVKNWEFSAWGSTGLEAEEREIDLSIKYSVRNFGIGITDYWFGSHTDSYRKGHIFELNLTYEFETISLSVGYHTIIYGDEGNHSGYFEASYCPAWKEWDFQFAAGLTPWNNQMAETEKFSVTHLSAGMGRDIPISDYFTLNGFANLIYNPNSESLFWIAGINIPF